MKRLLVFVFTALLLMSLVACGNEGTDNGAADGSGTAVAENPLALLDKVWSSYGEDERFAVAGGDFSEENANMEGPGKYGISDAAAVDASLGYPAGQIDKIDDAASIMHMMNANNFTCGVYSVKDKGQVSEVASAIADNLKVRQWMCGFPEKMLVMTVDKYVIAAFGSQELLDNFKAKTEASYPDVETVCYDPIS